MTKLYGFRPTLRLCYNETTHRGEALLQEMKWYDTTNSGGVGFVWTKGTSTAEGITSENSEAPIYFIFIYKVKCKHTIVCREKKRREECKRLTLRSPMVSKRTRGFRRNIWAIKIVTNIGFRGVFECNVSNVTWLIGTILYMWVPMLQVSTTASLLLV